MKTKKQIAKLIVTDETTDMKPLDKWLAKIKATQTTHPGMVCLFRIGDFFEVFFDDAAVMSKALGLTVTHRGTAPMAGFPHHQLEGYLHKLLKAGYRVAVCEEVK